MNISLPWPPSVNTYYRRSGRLIHISKAGKVYRKHVIEQVTYIHKLKEPMKGPLSITIICYPPDKRKRDLDNILKALLDSLQHAGVYEDDSQIGEIYMLRKQERHGIVDIVIEKARGDASAGIKLHS